MTLEIIISVLMDLGKFLKQIGVSVFNNRKEHRMLGYNHSGTVEKQVIPDQFSFRL